MVSYTSTNKLEQQAFNTNIDTWGSSDHLNGQIGLIDDSLDGALVLTIGSVPNPYSLTIADGVSSNGRNRQIIVKGTGASTFQINVGIDESKWWIVKNDSNVDVQMATTDFKFATIKPGDSDIIVRTGISTAQSDMFGVSPQAFIDTAVIYLNSGGPTANLDAEIVGRSVVVSRNLFNTIELDLNPDLVNESGTTVISIDRSFVGVKNVILTGIYKFDGTQDSDIALYGVTSWVRLTSISDAEPWKLGIVSGDYFNAV